MSCDAVLCVSPTLSSLYCFFFLMIRRPPRSTLDRSSAASDVYKRQVRGVVPVEPGVIAEVDEELTAEDLRSRRLRHRQGLSLIHISEPTRPY